MEMILVGLGGLVVGFIAGFLVFRNNQARFNKTEEILKDTAKKLK